MGYWAECRLCRGSLDIYMVCDQAEIVWHLKMKHSVAMLLSEA